ncbi:MAG TPA: zinc ribbon domain-containing protein [Labilithrix sp.]|jgi:putative FmdB family regulatory protein|nr:zinc ribbon domain-containing protein [Labilithrix sp.]
MPTYEYVCTDCQNHWEEIQKISEAPLEVCPKCTKSTAKRQISGGRFILKGGGWYADLYSSTPKKSDSGAPAKAESSAPAGGASSGSNGGASSTG